MEIINEEEEATSTPSSPSSLGRKLKSSLCLPSPFGRKHHQLTISTDVKPSSPLASPTPTSPTAWIKSRAHDIPEFKDWCKKHISRIGRQNSGHGHGHGHARGGHHRRHSVSADFRYDASSYALNFDDGGGDGTHDGEFPMRNFSSRLPPSPTKEIDYIHKKKEIECG